MTADGDTYTVTVIAGPTASGKSAAALEMARSRDGTIINADSVQLYNALPVLTARPGAEDLATAPHRLYGILPLSEPCSAAKWQSMALAEIEQARRDGRHAIICGGTGFYLLALIRGLSPMPDIPPEIRAQAREKFARLGNNAFFDELKHADPAIGARLHPNDSQRILRAREVLDATGKSLAEWQEAPREGPPDHLRFELVQIIPERAALYERIDRRFDAMLAAGALDEVDALQQKVAQGAVPSNAPPLRALGYSQLSSYLTGDITLEDACVSAKAETRRYAKRQITFIRSQLIDITPFTPEPEDRRDL